MATSGQGGGVAASGVAWPCHAWAAHQVVQPQASGGKVPSHGSCSPFWCESLGGAPTGPNVRRIGARERWHAIATRRPAASNGRRASQGTQAEPTHLFQCDSGSLRRIRELGARFAKLLLWLLCVRQRQQQRHQRKHRPNRVREQPSEAACNMPSAPTHLLPYRG